MTTSEEKYTKLKKDLMKNILLCNFDRKHFIVFENLNCSLSSFLDTVEEKGVFY